MHGRFARYSLSGDAHELALRAEEGMLPIFQSQGGFKAYSLLATDGEILSFSAWETGQDAEAANAAAATWVAGNMGGELELKETKVGEILLATALGVSAKAGATA
jgi:hypothetical protein